MTEIGEGDKHAIDMKPKKPIRLEIPKVKFFEEGEDGKKVKTWKTYTFQYVEELGSLYCEE